MFKGMKRFSFLLGTLPKVIVGHLFPTCRVRIGRVGNHAIEVKENGIRSDHRQLPPRSWVEVSVSSPWFETSDRFHCGKSDL
jgi:hypothetical protein